MSQVQSVFKVLSLPAYFLLALVAGWAIFSLSVWLPNLKLITVVALSADWQDTVSLLGSLYASIGSNFSFVSASYTIFIAFLFGINIALLTYYIRVVQGGMSEIKGTGLAGVGGLISGFFGIGCAACGTFILTSTLALFGAGGILAYLPFGGEEFGFIGVGLLLYSLYLLSKKISNPLVCEI